MSSHETTKEQENMAEEQLEAAEAAANPAEAAETDRAEAAEAAEESAEGTAAEDPRIAELQQQANEYNNRFLRVQADFDNYRRRTQKEKEELAQYASMKLIAQLLPVVDNFARALQTNVEQADGQSFQKGVDMIYRQLTQVLEAEGLKAMDPVGQPFDPEVHQAIMQVESDEYGEGVVVEVVQQGYWLKDKVIRPAMVKVSG